MAIREEFLNDIRTRVDIEDFISGYVSLKKQGRLAKGLCPFHSEKTPSFTVYPDTQSYYCFGCGKGGDVITFAREIENLDYVEAVKLLADRAGLNMPDDNYDDTLSKKRHRMIEMNKAAARFFHQYMLSEQGKQGLNYWLSRGLSMQTIRHFGLGYAPDDWHQLTSYMRTLGYSEQELVEADLAKKSVKGDKTYFYDNFRNRAMVPIIDLRGNIIAFGGRVLDDSKPKYVNTSDTLIYKKSQTVFALNFAKSSKEDKLILCEGYMDVITLHQAGFTNSVAGLGTALTDEQVRLISRYCDEVVLSYDNDEAGKKAMDKAISKFEQTGLAIRSLRLSGGKDPDEIIKKFGAERFKSIIDGASNEIEYKLLEKREKYDISTDDGRVKYLREAVPILARLPGAIEKDIYASRLADELSVGKEAIMLQIKDEERKLKRKEQKVDFGALRSEFDNYRDAATKDLTDNIKVAKAEETIISSLLNNPDYLTKIGEQLKPEDFFTEFNRRVFETLCERIRNNQSIDLIYLSSSFNPDEMGKIVKMRTGWTLISNTYKEVDDCIKVLLLEKDNGRVPDPSSLSNEEFLKLFKNKDNPTN